MNILIIGTGSIGTRHLNNIIALGYEQVAVVSRDKKFVTTSDKKNIHVYHSIDEAVLKTEFDTAIVCTPTAMHISDVKKLLVYDILNIYVEKPIGNTYEGIDDILKDDSYIKARIVIGFDLHFDPGLQKIKALLQTNTIGKLLSVNSTVGQYLPDWRPNEDYTKGTSAKKNMGGGVLLDLIHEFDYLYWLAGEVESLTAQYLHSGSLNIETEDLAEVLIKFKKGCLGTIHLDYLQPQLLRNCLITGSHGSIYWDMTQSEVKWINSNKESSSFSYKGFERNDRFKEIMKSFLSNTEDYRLTHFKDGLKSLQMVLAAKQAALHNIYKNPNEIFA